MLKKGRQRAHFKEVWESMLAHLLDFYATRDPEELHQFRVEIKKINALLLLLQGHTASRHLEPLQAVFKHAGRIRSAQINIQHAGQYRLSGSGFKDEQEKIEKEETKRFFAKRRAYLKKIKRIYKTLARGFGDINDKSISDLYKKRLKKLARFFARPHTRADKLHKNRKKMKNLLYLHAMLPKSLVKKLSINILYLDRLQEAIGKWHDVVSVLEILKTEVYSDKKNLDKLGRQSRRMRASIRAMTDDFAVISFQT